MSKRLKIAFFICTVLCYIFTLIAYFQLDFRFFLAASILQAVFLLLFSFLSLRPDSSRDETESRITSIKKEWSFETQELKSQLSTKEEYYEGKEKLVPLKKRMQSLQLGSKNWKSFLRFHQESRSFSQKIRAWKRICLCCHSFCQNPANQVL